MRQLQLELVERVAQDRDPLRDGRVRLRVDGRRILHAVASPQRLPPGQLACLLHRVEHDADEDVQHDERGDEDEAHEVQPRPRLDRHGGIHVHREVLEREHHEQREHRAADVAPFARKLVTEPDPPDHPVDEEDHRRHRADRRERRHASPDPEEKHAQVRQQPDDPHHSQKPEQAQERRVLADPRDEHREDHHEVEDVPAVSEELERTWPVRRHPDEELDDEDPEADAVDHEQPVAPAVDGALVRLQPEHGCVHRDRGDDDRGEGRRVDDASEGVTFGHGP